MKKIILIFLIFSTSIYAHAQKEKGKAVLFGRVMDANLDEPLPFVTVFVRKPNEEEILAGQITDEDGKFEVTGLPSGALVVEIQFVGFTDVSQEIFIQGKNEKLDLGNMLMYDEVEVLGTVEVTVERSTIEQKVDRKVINIGKDLATVGPTAADLMVNLPSVDVDQNGDVSMRGNENVIVLVDGKPTNQSASQLLQQIPSGSIKSIELITNPSAKYVPDGMSGIINIVLHKNTNLGFNGSISGGLTAGEEQRYNGSADLNYRREKTNFFLNYAQTDGPTPTRGVIDRRSDDSEEIWFALNDRTSHLLKGGVDVDLTEQTTLSAYSTINWFNNRSFRSTDILFSQSEALNFGQEYASLVKNFTSTYNLDLKHQFENESTLELEIDHSIFDGDEEADFQLYGSTFDLNNAIELIGTNRENTTLNLDYENRLGDSKKLEAGLEARIQNTDNSYETTNPNFVNANYDLDRNIYAGYISYSHELGKWSYQVGARLEAFDQASQFIEQGSQATQFNDLIYAIYPSAFLTYVPNPTTQKNSFNLGVSRRVDRPNLTQINPMRAWSSARIANVGNPALIPQFTNSVEFNYIRQLKVGSVTSGVFYRRISDEITRFGFNDVNNPENILFSYSNYRNNSAYGFEASGNYQLTSWWSLTSNFDLYAQKQRGVAQDEFREVQNVIYNFRVNQSFKANKKLTFQLVGLYRGGNRNLQYKTLAFYFINLGARYSTFEGKGTLSVNFNDVFHTQQFSFEGERPVPQKGVFDWDSQTFFVGYSHRFGSGKKKALNRKKRDTNEKKSSGGF